VSGYRGRSTRLAVAVLDHGATRVLELTGELDVAGAPRVAKAAAHALAENHTDLLIDLCDVTFIDSMGLSVLLTIKRRVMGRGGRLRVACAPGEVTRALEVTRLNLEFDLFATRSAALAAGPTG
jgi:anti-sigma B factor antagonist